MGKYISDIKTALAAYQDMKNKSEQHLTEIRELYGEEAYNRESDRQKVKLQEARTRTETAILDAHKRGRAETEAWGKLDGSRLTDDTKLLDAGLVDVEEFEKLKERYQDNATMLLALKKYGEKRNAEKRQEYAEQDQRTPYMIPIPEPYNVRDIATLPDRLHNWDMAKAQAMEVLDMIDGTGNYSDDWNQVLGKSMSAELVETFGEGSGL